MIAPFRNNVRIT